MGTTTATLYVKPAATALLSVDGKSAAVMFLKPIATALLSVDGKSGAVMFVPVRALNGTYNGAGIQPSANTRNLKTALPNATTPIGFVMVKGERLPVLIDDAYWYAFFRYQTEVVLGGFKAATLADIATSIKVDKALAIANAASATALAQQTAANAQVLAAVREVAVLAALPGSPQIPQVQLVPADTNPTSYVP